MGGLGYRDPKAARTSTPHTQDIIWAAGFYEGDGSTSRPQSTEMVTIMQKDDWVLNRLCVLFGGRVGTRRKQGINAHTYHVWQLCGARARGFLQSIYELLSPRRQAQIRKTLQVD